MIPKERFDAALAFAPVDRPPLFYQHLGAAKWILQHTNLTMREGFEKPEVFAKLAMASHELFGFDNVMAGWGDLLIEPQAHGLEWKFPEKDFYPRPAQYLDMSKVDQVQPVDPMKDRFWSVPLKAASIMQDKIGRNVKVVGCLDSPLLIASETVGMENILMAQYTAPDTVLKLVATITESCIAYSEYLRAIAINVVFVDNSSAGMDLNSLDMCEKTDHHFLRTLMTKMRSNGIGTILHNDSVHPYLQKQLELDPIGLHFHLKNVDMKSTFDMARGKTCVLAGIDHTELLFQKTPADINIEVVNIMETWGKAPGFMIAPGCEMPYKTPMGNIKALKESVERYSQ